jgi:hypothetical protein
MIPYTNVCAFIYESDTEPRRYKLFIGRKSKQSSANIKSNGKTIPSVFYTIDAIYDKKVIGLSNETRGPDVKYILIESQIPETMINVLNVVYDNISLIAISGSYYYMRNDTYDTLSLQLEMMKNM